MNRSSVFSTSAISALSRGNPAVRGAPPSDRASQHCAPRQAPPAPEQTVTAWWIGLVG